MLQTKQDIENVLAELSFAKVTALQSIVENETEVYDQNNPPVIDDYFISITNVPQLIYRALYLVRVIMQNNELHVQEFLGVLDDDDDYLSEILEKTLVGLLCKPEEIFDISDITDTSPQQLSEDELFEPTRERLIDTRKQIAETIRNLKTLNTAISEVHQKLRADLDEELMLEKLEDLKVCQIPGCSNTISITQGKAAKYCLECHADGSVKRLSNQKYRERRQANKLK